jgi:hypothetical protein
MVSSESIDHINAQSDPQQIPMHSRLNQKILESIDEGICVIKPLTLPGRAHNANIKVLYEKHTYELVWANKTFNSLFELDTQTTG